MDRCICCFNNLYWTNYLSGKRSVLINAMKIVQSYAVFLNLKKIFPQPDTSYNPLLGHLGEVLKTHPRDRAALFRSWFKKLNCDTMSFLRGPDAILHSRYQFAFPQSQKKS